MIDSQSAKKWAAMPDFPNRISSWTWFKSAVSEYLALSAQSLLFQCELRNADLADAFFHWAGYLDSSQDFSKLDPVDYAHYACGMLLTSFIQAHPISVIKNQTVGPGVEKSFLDQMNWPEDLVLLCLTLTLLESWRLHVGAEPLVVNLEVLKSHWNSFHENAREDTFSTVPFLDFFLGLKPVWEDPMTASNRPAMRVAVARLHSSHS